MYRYIYVWKTYGRVYVYLNDLLNIDISDTSMKKHIYTWKLYYIFYIISLE